MMKQTTLAKAVSMVLGGTALVIAGISTASATATTAYNTFNNGAAPNLLVSTGGVGTDGWTRTADFIDPNDPNGEAVLYSAGNPYADGAGTSNSSANGAAVPWVGFDPRNSLANGGFGYAGTGVLHWAVNMTGGGNAEISRDDSFAKYGIHADIDTAKGAWSDNVSSNVGVAGGWRHDLEFGLFKSDVNGTVTLNIEGVNLSGTDFGFTIFKGMDSSTTGYGHHGVWNSTTNNSGLTANSLPGGGTKFGVNNADALNHIVAYSVGDPNTNINNISFDAEANQIYTIVLGGFRNGNWSTTIDNYKLTVSQVPVPGAVWLFGSALVGLVGVQRRKQQAV